MKSPIKCSIFKHIVTTVKYDAQISTYHIYQIANMRLTSHHIGAAAVSRTLCTAPGRARPYRRFNFSPQGELGRDQCH